MNDLGRDPTRTRCLPLKMRTQKTSVKSGPQTLWKTFNSDLNQYHNFLFHHHHHCHHCHHHHHHHCLPALPALPAFIRNNFFPFVFRFPR